MHYRLGFSSKLENSNVYIECSVRKPGVNHPIREIVKRFGSSRGTGCPAPLSQHPSCGSAMGASLTNLHKAERVQA